LVVGTCGRIQMSKESNPRNDKAWNHPEPVLFDLRKILDHPSVTISSEVKNGRRRIVISGDEDALEELYQKLLED